MMGAETRLLAAEEGPRPGVPAAKMVSGSASMVFDDLRGLSHLPVSEGASNMRAGGMTL